MPAHKPEECDRLFEDAVNAGDVDAVVALYEPEGSLMRHDGGVATGHAAIREVLAALVAIQPALRNNVVRIVQAGDGLALLYNDWAMSAKGRGGHRIERTGKAVEVVRRQADGTWRFVVDDPYARG